jgi:hypothetical protein
MRSVLPGVNIQFPISREILAGKKTIETRTYPLPLEYVGQELAVIETPGSTGEFKARVVATIRFGESFRYKNKKEFYSDSKRHLVTPNSPWRWEKPKWGWPILAIDIKIEVSGAPRKKGIIFTKSVPVRRLR